jgi:hypothetical protein
MAAHFLTPDRLWPRSLVGDRCAWGVQPTLTSGDRLERGYRESIGVVLGGRGSGDGKDVSGGPDGVLEVSWREH